MVRLRDILRLTPYPVLLSLALLVTPAAAERTALRGTVTIAPGGGPAAGLWVDVTRIGEVLTGFPGPAYRPEDAHASAYTDARGRFQLNGLPPGVYEVEVARDSLPAWLAPEAGPFRTVLVSPRDRARVDLTVTTLATVEGTVSHRLGGPVRGGRVALSRRGESAAWRTRNLDAQGRYRLPALDRGVAYRMQAVSERGLYRRVEFTPLRAGLHEIDVELPNWSQIQKRRVVAHVAVPRAGEGPLLLEWVSLPADADEGFHGTVPMDRDGRAEFESPTGVFEARVVELTDAGRRWVGERYFRVTPGEIGPQVLRFPVREAPSGAAAPPTLSEAR